MAEKVFKQSDIILNVSAKSTPIQSTNTTFYSYDRLTAKTTIQLLEDEEPLPLVNASDITVVFTFDSGKADFTATVEDLASAIISIVIPDEYLGYVGDVLGGVFVRYKNGQSLDVGYFSFTMKKSTIDSDLPEIQDYYVQKFEEVKSDILGRADVAEQRLDKIETQLEHNDVVPLHEYTENKNSVNQQLAETMKLEEHDGVFLKLARYTKGYGNDGAVLAAIANNPDPKAQVTVWEKTSDASKYSHRDSVAVYVSNTSTTPTFAINSGNIVYGAKTVQIPAGNNLNEVQAGMMIDTLHTPNRYTSIVEGVDVANNIINIKDGWYKVVDGGSTSPEIPNSDIGFNINMVTKIWGVNNNVFLDEGDLTNIAVAEEIGLFNEKETGDIGGIDIVAFGPYNAAFGYRVRDTKNGRVSIGYDAQGCLYALRVLSDNIDEYIVSSFDKNGTFTKDNFYIKNDGTQSKLKLETLDVTSITQQMYASISTALFNVPVNSVYTLPNPATRVGRFLFLKNNGSNFTLKTPSGYIFSALTNDNDRFQFEGQDAIILLCDGANYHIMKTDSTSVKRYGDQTKSGNLTVEGTVAATGNVSAMGTNSMLKTASSKWNEGHLMLGGYHLWVDSSGRLRIKSGDPANETDGTIVGMQS